MARIIIYGGTFNPIHNGHIHFVKRASELLGAEKAIIVPSGESRHKTSFNLVNPSDRLEMCKLATEGMPGIEISDFEASQKGFSYTSDTIEYFKGIYPEEELCLLVGSDNFLSIDRWYGSERILSRVTLCGAVRKGGSVERVKDKCNLYLSKGQKVEILDIDTIDMSSTRIRDSVLEGNDISGMTPLKVKDYIVENGFYKEVFGTKTSLSLKLA